MHSNLIIPAVAAAISVFAATSPHGAHAQGACTAPEPVCRMADRVFAISSFDPQASAILIDQGLLVTNRHVVADNTKAQVRLSDGRTLKARVTPTGMVRDLVLLRVDGLAHAPPLPLASPSPDGPLYVIGMDIGRGTVRVYQPGRLLAAPLREKPKSRIHHNAQSFPGNSGGALVDVDGRLVGVVASGGEGRGEAIPAAEIARLRSQSGKKYADASRTLGIAYRQCTVGLDKARAQRQPLTPSYADRLTLDCRRTGNRQLMDDLGRLMGQQRMLARAAAMLKDSLALDPLAPNTLLSMAIILHLQQRYWDEVQVLKKLIKMLPHDQQVLRLAIQAGTWGDDPAFAQQGFDLLSTHHPQAAPAAKRFLDNPPPRPQTPAPR